MAAWGVVAWVVQQLLLPVILALILVDPVAWWLPIWVPGKRVMADCVPIWAPAKIFFGFFELRIMVILRSSSMLTTHTGGLFRSFFTYLYTI